MNEFEPKVKVFCCENSSFLVANKIPRNEIPDNVTVVKVPCCGQVGNNEILKALKEDGDGLLLIPCPYENCKHLTGNEQMEKRVESVKKIIDEIGISTDRIKVVPIAANDEFSFREAINTMYENLINLGPIEEGKVSR